MRAGKKQDICGEKVFIVAGLPHYTAGDEPSC